MRSDAYPSLRGSDADPQPRGRTRTLNHVVRTRTLHHVVRTRTLHHVVDGPLTAFFGGRRARDPVTAEAELPFEALFEPHGDRIARLLADRLAQGGLYWQLVRAVAESHEGGPERPAIDGAAHLHQPVCAEVLGRLGHDDIGPAALARALLQCCREGSV